jgi:hypothetical protein
MAATERVVVLMTPEQKKAVVRRARAEKLSLSDYMRRQALGDDPLLTGLLSELQQSTTGARAALERVIARLEQAEALQSEAEDQARRLALREFQDIDGKALARFLGLQDGEPENTERRSQEAA